MRHRSLYFKKLFYFAVADKPTTLNYDYVAMQCTAVTFVCYTRLHILLWTLIFSVQHLTPFFQHGAKECAEDTSASKLQMQKLQRISLTDDRTC